MDTRFEKILTGLMMLSAVGIIALLCFSGVRQTGEAAASSINDHPGIMRFHVIANSDSEKDQTLKLEVRDYVLQRVEAGITAAIASENNENGDQYSADAYDHQAAITRNYINENQNKKILTLENPVEYKHHSKKSLIVQKEVGRGRDSLTFSDGVKNSLREDCDILVIGEIRDKVTMEAAIEMAESGHLVIGTLHTKSCAETIDRMINFYEVRDQASIKYLLSALLKLVVSQRLLKGTDGKLVLVPEVMVVDNIVAGIIRKEKLSVSEIEDAIQSNLEKGSIGLINSLAELFVEDRITLEQAKAQIEEKNIETLNRTIMQLKIKKGK